MAIKENMLQEARSSGIRSKRYPYPGCAATHRDQVASVPHRFCRDRQEAVVGSMLKSGDKVGALSAR